MAAIKQLLEQFTATFEAGEEPDLAAILAEADNDSARQELADRIDSYLMEAPRRQWDPIAYESSPARDAVERAYESIEGVSGSWPVLLPHLRHRAKIKRSELVWKLAAALGVNDQERVADYYNQMEHGNLAAHGVSDRVIEALAGIYGASAELIRRAGEATMPPASAGAVFTRTATPDPAFDEASPPSAPEREEPDPGETDEVDRLFTGG